MLCIAIFLCVLLSVPASYEYEAAQYISDIETLVQNMATYQYPSKYEDFYKPKFLNGGLFGTFDFIIVGAGSAGSVLANRLSEVNGWRVLVLEAGGDETEYTDVPGITGLLQFTPFNYGFRSTPQTTCCLGMADNICNVPRGKGVGGTSLINFMVYSRGHKKDYDLWAADGNPGWSYKDVLPYFLKSENATLDAPVDPEYHSNRGSLHVEHVKYFTDLGQAYLDANQELGQSVLDYNGVSGMGVSRIQANTINGRRCSANKAFIKPVVDRPNLVIQRGAFVTKVIISANTKRVHGVRFVMGEKVFYALASKEVILSAGAINSPQLLMLSGIGPRDDLQKLNIAMVEDLNVGRGLYDHVFFPHFISTNYTENLRPLNEAVDEYISGSGMLTTAGNFQTIGFQDTDNEISDYPNIEHLFSPFFPSQDGYLKHSYGYTDETLAAFTQGTPVGGPFFLNILLHPHSKGTVSLKSKNPFDHPLIDLNFLSDPYDVEALLSGVKYLNTIMQTDAMKKFNASNVTNPLPKCADFKFGSDDYYRCAIRQLSTTLYHHTGTCKMGPGSDPNAVVDHNCRVIGIENLRVIDASVIPFPLSGHPIATVYMIAEKMSDVIKRYWNIR